MLLKGIEQSAQDLLPLLPKNPSRIIEIGYHPTNIFKTCAASNPKVEYTTILHSLEHKEKSNLINLNGQTQLKGNVEKISFKELGIPLKSVDCLILINVLENMINPWQFLDTQFDLLTEDGVVVTTYQNFGHWSTIYNLIRGEWMYKNSLMPQREQIRFYTPMTMGELFEGEGFVITNYLNRHKKDENYQNFVSIFSSALQKINIDMKIFEEQAATISFIVQAKKKPPSTLRKTSNDYYRKACESIQGDILNIGSANDRDGMGGRYKDYFKKNATYATLDVEPHNRPDIIGSIENLTGVVADESYNAVFCAWVLEHVKNVESSISELHRILRKNGSLIFGLPLNIKFHSFPADYHRYTVQGIRELLKDKFEIYEIEKVGTEEAYHHDPRLSIFGDIPETAPLGYVGIALKI